MVWVETQAFFETKQAHVRHMFKSIYAITNKRTDRKRYEIFAKKEMEHLMPEIGEKEKKTVISVVGKREWDPSLGRWLFWEWTET